MRDPKVSDPKASDAEIYGDNEVTEYTHTRTPRWLIWLYIIMPIWAIVWLLLTWNGQLTWLDKNHWFALEQAANTTYPFETPEGLDPADDTPYIHPL